MKKLLLLFTIFLHQINDASCPSAKRRPCQLRYTNAEFRKDMGNDYLQKAIQDIHNPKNSKHAAVNPKNQPQKSKYAHVNVPSISNVSEKNLDGLLTIHSIFPAIYYLPKLKLI